jgi:hypothetical protein
MKRRAARAAGGCERCGHPLDLDVLLGQVERQREVARYADGGEESSGLSALEYRCGHCRQASVVPLEQVAELILEKQTRQLFSSISQVLRGHERVH